MDEAKRTSGESGEALAMTSYVQVRWPKSYACRGWTVLAEDFGEHGSIALWLSSLNAACRSAVLHPFGSNYRGGSRRAGS